MEAVQTNGMRTIDRIRQHHYANRKFIDVPEWPDEDGEPLRIYYSELTGHDVNQLNARETKNDPEYVATLVALKAQKEDGSLHFSMGDVHALLQNTHYPTLFRIAQAIQTRFTLPGGTVDEVKKPLETTENMPSVVG